MLRRVRQRTFPTRNPVAASFRARWHKEHGAGARSYLPGGLAGYESQLLIGASLSDAAGWRNASEAQAWARAGLIFASISAQNESALRRSLGFAAAFGTLVVASGGSSQMDAARVRGLITRLSCHPNLAGFSLEL